MASQTPKDDDDGGSSTIIIIINRIKAAARKIWVHPIGKPMVYVALGFILGAVIL